MFFWSGNWGSERWVRKTSDTELVSGKARSQAQAVWLQHLRFYPPLCSAPLFKLLTVPEGHLCGEVNRKLERQIWTLRRQVTAWSDSFDRHQYGWYSSAYGHGISTQGEQKALLSNRTTYTKIAIYNIVRETEGQSQVSHMRDGKIRKMAKKIQLLFWRGQDKYEKQSFDLALQTFLIMFWKIPSPLAS